MRGHPLPLPELFTQSGKSIPGCWRSLCFGLLGTPACPAAPNCRSVSLASRVCVRGSQGGRTGHHWPRSRLHELVTSEPGLSLNPASRPFPVLSGPRAVRRRGSAPAGGEPSILVSSTEASCAGQHPLPPALSLEARPRRAGASGCCRRTHPGFLRELPRRLRCWHRAVFPVSECPCPCRHVLSVRVPESAGAAPGGSRATFDFSSTRDPRWMSCETGRF